jgi:putative cardiolipin synthase
MILFSVKPFSRVLVMMGLIALGGCASLPDNSNRTASWHYTDTDNTTLGELVEQRRPAHAAGESGYLLLNDGLDAFVARAVLAQLAGRSIDTQYYMWHKDEVGSLLAYQLLKAADRGVRVRILLDDIDEGGRDINLAVFDAHPNIEVRIFNPFGRNIGRTLQFVSGFGKQTRRAHNKSFTVDSQATILGGRNIGDEYFSADPDLAFADLDVLAIGPVAQQVSNSFDEYWNSPLSYPVATMLERQPDTAEVQLGQQIMADFTAAEKDSPYLQRLNNSELANSIRDDSVKFIWGGGKVFADPPEKLTRSTGDRDYQMWTDVKPYMAAARQEVIILSPYFVPGKSGVAFLKQLRERGVRVRILTNSLASTDVSIVHAGYARYRKDLLRAGVELYELNEITSREDRRAWSKGEIERAKSSLHAKSFVVDRASTFIGSLNLDARSVVQNTEIGVIIESSEIASRMADNFDQQIDKVAFRLTLEDDEQGGEQLRWHGLVDGIPVTFDNDPNTSFWRRFGIGFMRLLPIESQI